MSVSRADDHSALFRRNNQICVIKVHVCRAVVDCRREKPLRGEYASALYGDQHRGSATMCKVVKISPRTRDAAVRSSSAVD
jgi:hypothetical protein